jgi:uncharacterized membrane protein YfhO
MKNKYLFLDKFGIFASSLCAVHCSVTPFVITLLPFLGLSFLESDLFENSMLGIAVFIGILSLLPSYIKKHHNIKPIILFLLGILFIISSHLIFHDNGEFIIAPVGGILIIISHLLNSKLSHKKCDYHVK